MTVSKGGGPWPYQRLRRAIATKEGLALFYVYELRDPRTGVAFYVGKGQGDRAYQHQRQVVNDTATTNPAKIAKIKEILATGKQVEVAIVAEYVYEEDALDHEFHLIDSNSTLTNALPGGASNGKASELYLAKMRYDQLVKLCLKLLGIKKKIKFPKKGLDLPRKAIRAVVEYRDAHHKGISIKDAREIENWLNRSSLLTLQSTNEVEQRELARDFERGHSWSAKYGNAIRLRDEAKQTLLNLRRKKQQQRAAQAEVRV